MDDTMQEIGHYMSSPVLSIESEATVQEAAQYMRAQHVGALLVKEFDEYVGIISESDLSHRVIGGGLNPETTLVSTVMTRTIHSMDRYLPAEEADEFMRKHKIHHLAITQEDKIVGMVSIKDFISFYYTRSFQMME
ncbi:MAG: cyclic nucleotide-binding/CBS domain-containing protein [Nitrospinales bacterium]